VFVPISNERGKHPSGSSEGGAKARENECVFRARKMESTRALRVGE
jgi:hypothetical protein